MEAQGRFEELTHTTYKGLYGYYPELVLADKAYLSKENRRCMRVRGINQAGPPLGRLPTMSAEKKRKRKKEQNKRSEIEGKFCQAKSKYGLDDIKIKRADTSKVEIVLIWVNQNIIKIASAFYSVFCRFLLRTTVSVLQKLAFIFIYILESIKYTMEAKRDDRFMVVWGWIFEDAFVNRILHMLHTFWSAGIDRVSDKK